jgi:hypothetical protein
MHFYESGDVERRGDRTAAERWHEGEFSNMQIDKPTAYLDKLLTSVVFDWSAVKRSWAEWSRGVAIESPGDFWQRCLHWHKRKQT